MITTIKPEFSITRNFNTIGYQRNMSYAIDQRPPQARFRIALFTWSGRMNRITYLFWFLLLWVVLLLTAMIVSVAVSTGIAAALYPELFNATGQIPDLRGHPVQNLPTLLIQAYAALALTGTSAITAKRLRDAGWPLWLMPLSLLALLEPILLPLVGLHGTGLYLGSLGWLLFSLLLMLPPSHPVAESAPNPMPST